MTVRRRATLVVASLAAVLTAPWILLQPGAAAVTPAGALKSAIISSERIYNSTPFKLTHTVKLNVPGSSSTTRSCIHDGVSAFEYDSFGNLVEVNTPSSSYVPASLSPAPVRALLPDKAQWVRYDQFTALGVRTFHDLTTGVLTASGKSTVKSSKAAGGKLIYTVTYRDATRTTMKITTLKGVLQRVERRSLTGTVTQEYQLLRSTVPVVTVPVDGIVDFGRNSAVLASSSWSGSIEPELRTLAETILSEANAAAEHLSRTITHELLTNAVAKHHPESLPGTFLMILGDKLEIQSGVGSNATLYCASMRPYDYTNESFEFAVGACPTAS